MHVLHPSLGGDAATRSSHTENTPPLWYLLAWADARVLGTGEVALRLPSALAGIATVPVAWAIGRELGRPPRAAIARAALVAVNPLFVWYSQEARAYGAVRVDRARWRCCASCARCASRRARRLAAFALTGSLALLTHYFAVFLLIPMALWLLCEPARPRARRRCRRSARSALVGLALIPLISAQGGHGTQWIGRWALSEPPAGDPAVLPHRLLRRAARARRRAARRAADPRRRWRWGSGACAAARAERATAARSEPLRARDAGAAGADRRRRAC